MRAALLTVLAFGAAIVSCQAIGGSLGVTPIPAPRAAVQVEGSRFESSIKVLGIEGVQPGSRFNRFYLRSWIYRNPAGVSHELYVQDFYDGDWKYWSRANSQDAEGLPFTSIARDVVGCGTITGCSFSESFEAAISDSVLRAHRGGYGVKFYARSGAPLVITLSAEQIGAQLRAVDSVRSVGG